MATATQSTVLFQHAAQLEIKQIDQEIAGLNARRQLIHQFASPTGASRSVMPKKKTSSKKSSTTRKSSPTRKTRSSKMSASDNGGPSTMEMARQVLRNAAVPMTARDIREGIKNDFGVVPVVSLSQMLYKRAKDRSGFFKKDGRYGLLPPEEREHKAA